VDWECQRRADPCLCGFSTGTKVTRCQQRTEKPDYRPFPFRATLEGFTDVDAVAPTLAFTSASATKLRRSGTPAYTIRVAFSLRDDVEGNTVTYTLRVKEGKEHSRDRQLWEIDYSDGSTAAGSASMKLRVYPSSKRVRSVELRLTGSDTVGNEVSITRWVKLQRGHAQEGASSIPARGRRPRARGPRSAGASRARNRLGELIAIQ
jgi:hypothetical protein